MLHRLLSAAKRFWVQANEKILNIDTLPTPEESFTRHPGEADRPFWFGVKTDRAAFDDNYNYETVDYWNIRSIIRVMRPTPEDVFYDLGCGKGRVLCVMARRRLRRCVGIEIDESLYRQAAINAQRLRGRKTPIELILGDVATADLSGGTIYFMFNPFGTKTMKGVLDNIRGTLERRPRRIRIVYQNPEEAAVLNECEWLCHRARLRTPMGGQISFWTNDTGPGALAAPKS